MSKKRRDQKRHTYSHPGDGSYYVLCDVCGKKVRQKDTVLIEDKLSNQYNLLVCFQDADVTNPQMYIKEKRERQTPDPEFLRGEGTDQFVNIDVDPEIETGDTTPAVGKYVLIIDAGLI